MARLVIGAALTANFQTPAVRELATRDQWLLWKRVCRKDKVTGEDRPTKPPFTTDGRTASSIDPGTWTTFDEALRAVPIPSHERGIGFVFTADDPFVGIDIDGCRDPLTGQIAEWGQTLIDSIDSYTEVSPTSTGVKLIVKGTLPEAGRKTELADVDRVSFEKPAIEMYASARYFTITGEHLAGTPNTIEPRQAAIDTLYARYFRREKREKREKSDGQPADRWCSPGLTDQEVLELAFAARNGARIRRLYEDGDIGAYDNDESRADQALASMLAFYTGDDLKQLWRLIQVSALYRAKWDRPDYRARTLERALDGLTATYERSRGRGAAENVGERVITVGGAHIGTETGQVSQGRDDWPAPMAQAAFHGPLGAFVTSVSGETEADPAAVLLMTMSAISAVFDAHTFIKAGDAHHPIRINAILVGPTASGRKGTAGKIAEALARQADKGFVSQIVEGLSSGEGLLWAIRDAITKRDLKTGADVVVDAGVADKRLWVLETEFATTLRVVHHDH